MSLILLIILLIIIACIVKFGSNFVLDKFIFPSIKYMSKESFKKFRKFVEQKNTLLIYKKTLRASEYFFILLMIIFIAVSLFCVLSPSNSLLNFLFFGLLAFFLFCTIFIGDFNLNIKKELEKNQKEYESLIENTISKVNRNSYIFDRLKVFFGKTGMSLYFHCLFLILILTFLTEVNSIPYSIFYLFLLTLPLTLASWIYFSTFNTEEQNIRRIIGYLLLLIITISKSFSDFKIVIGLEVADSANDYIMFLILTVFTAIDRLLKSIVDDYTKFKIKKKNC
ncbi:hypothetical protein [Bacillus licheniformis]|uniref:hypothetical protein n=1 Tax=Bacillus licheniformis TaxID=1402 RepID=UPI003F8D2A63